MRHKTKFFLVTFLALLAIYFIVRSDFGAEKNNSPVVNGADQQALVDAVKPSLPAPAPQVEESKGIFTDPLKPARSRVTKKFFGTKVSPQDSPVSPERFSGYHTGVDFETTEAEQKTEVSISTICSGKILSKRWVSGYGGVVLQSCQLDQQVVTVIYGHLKLDSIGSQLNDRLEAGQYLGLLGQGYSQETDGERKHLHLSIHRGPEISLRGYVASSEDLAQWIDALILLQ